jgi:hypothetical protein
MICNVELWVFAFKGKSSTNCAYPWAMQVQLNDAGRGPEFKFWQKICGCGCARAHLSGRHLGCRCCIGIMVESAKPPAGRFWLARMLKSVEFNFETPFNTAYMRHVSTGICSITQCVTCTVRPRLKTLALGHSANALQPVHN